jgi:4,5-dihydroxyphthalate decarboxylase
MQPLPITTAFWDYDRTLPIIRGLVPIEGCDVNCIVLPPQDTFVRAFATAEFDVCELSLSRYAQNIARGTSAYSAIPVFLSRTFRHASLYVRNDHGIEKPADLKGKRIGVNNYDDTAAVVVRGMLRDVYGLRPDDVTWVIGDFDRPRRNEITRPDLNRDIPTEAAAPGETLDQLLTEGRIDGLIGLVPPPSFNNPDSKVRRLFPDWRRDERDYYQQTGIFPIMHVVGIRRSLVEAHPWLPFHVFTAFAAAKQRAMDDLAMLQAPKSSLPWLVAELRETQQLMGEDFWAYGVEANRKTLAASMRHLREDGLLARDVAVDELFIPWE